jgi:hypothetical protein
MVSAFRAERFTQCAALPLKQKRPKPILGKQEEKSKKGQPFFSLCCPLGIFGHFPTS